MSYNNNEQNIFDKDGIFAKADNLAKEKQDQAAQHYEEIKGGTQAKMDQAKKSENTISDNIGGFIDQSKDTTGKFASDAKAKISEVMAGDKKK